MPRIDQLALPLVTLAAALAVVPVSSPQQHADPPPAPVPSQIFTAKKIFISNASGETAAAFKAPDLPYNEFYAAMKAWGRYELVPAPADADLVFEFRYVATIAGVTVLRGDGSSVPDYEFRLTILDPKTRVILWAFTESLRKVGKQTDMQVFDQALDKTVDDVKKLAIPH